MTNAPSRALPATDIPVRSSMSGYPEPFRSRVGARVKRALGDPFEQELQPGDCIGFPAEGLAHHLVNESGSVVTYLEIGDRTPGDSGEYPEDDLKAEHRDGGYVFMHKDGAPY